MRRRYLLQFGVTILAAAGLSGAAFAADGVTVTNSGNTSTVIDQNSQTTITQTHDTVTTSGGAGPTDSNANGNGDGRANNGNQNAVNPTDENDVNNTPNALILDATDPDTTPVTTPVSSVSVSVDTAVDYSSSAATTAVSYSRHMFNVIEASLQMAVQAPLAAQPVASHSSLPHVPANPTDFLNGLQSLASIVVPAAGWLAATAAVLGASLILPITILILLALTVTTAALMVNLYTARLRHGGFLGAARSHVLGAFTFATPQKNGLYLGAYAT